MDFLELSQKRYSCRKFSDRPVEKEKIAKIIEAARNAPSAVNFQPIHVWIVSSPRRLDDIKECTKYHFDAPCVLIFGYKEEEAWTRKFDGKNFGDVDATISATQAMLEIENLGLGSTWVGFFDPAKAKEKFPEADGYVITALFPFGYPADDAEPAPQHNIRKTVEEFATEL